MSRATNTAYRCMAIDTADSKDEKILVDVQTILADCEASAKTEFTILNAEALKGKSKEVDIIVVPFRCAKI